MIGVDIMGFLVVVGVLAVIGIVLSQRQKKKVTPSRPVGLDGSGTTRPADDTTILPTTDT